MGAAVKFPPMAEQIASLYPDAIASRFEREFSKFYDKAEGRPVDRWQVGQRWLRGVHDGYESNKIKGIPLYAKDEQLVERAEDCAAGAMRIRTRYAGADLSIQFERLSEYCKGCGVKPPELLEIEKAILWLGTAEAKAERIAPKVERMQCARWWRRRIRDKHTRTNERLARELGMVRKQERPYISQVGLRVVKQRQDANAETLSRMEAVNTVTGESMIVSEVAKTGVSNPDVRYDEMITRVMGIQTIARQEKLAGRFVTLTAPARFHSHYKKSGQRTEKHNGETPRKAQKWLSNVWALVRSQLSWMGLEVAGLRVAEPHHDGCPHWHMILFFKSEVSALHFEWAIRGHAYEAGDSVDECNARLDFKTIDLVKHPNGVVGYLVKYLTKNLSKKDADKAKQQMGFDFETDEGFADGIERIRAWASVWGLRQFQFIGGASVTVWRELRRIKQPLENERLERMRLACGIEEPLVEAKDRKYPPDWAAYLYQQGGLFSSSRQQLVTLIKQEKNSVYGDKAQKVVGVQLGDCKVITREEWVVQQVGEPRQQLMEFSEAERAKQAMLDGVAGAMDLSLWKGVELHTYIIGDDGYHKWIPNKHSMITYTPKGVEARGLEKENRTYEEWKDRPVLNNRVVSLALGKPAKAGSWTCVNNCTEYGRGKSRTTIAGSRKTSVEAGKKPCFESERGGGGTSRRC